MFDFSQSFTLRYHWYIRHLLKTESTSKEMAWLLQYFSDVIIKRFDMPQSLYEFGKRQAR